MRTTFGSVAPSLGRWLSIFIMQCCDFFANCIAIRIAWKVSCYIDEGYGLIVSLKKIRIPPPPQNCGVSVLIAWNWISYIRDKEINVKILWETFKKLQALDILLRNLHWCLINQLWRNLSNNTCNSVIAITCLPRLLSDLLTIYPLWKMWGLRS